LAYQKVLTPGREAEGGLEFGEVWRQARGGAKAATEQAVEHLASELQRQVSKLPDEILFLRGMAAYKRNDRPRAKRDFEAVYRNGRPGDIYAIAAHLLGKIERDSRKAEEAFQASLNWNSDPEDRAQVWHSLGYLLSRDPRRWREAEDAFHKSLDLLHDPEDQAQVWHSLGILLSKNQRRWNEAEDAFHKSLDLRHDPEHQAQVWHSLGLLRVRQGNLTLAEDAYDRSYNLNRYSRGKAQVRASWALAIVELGKPSDYERARTYAIESIKLDPSNALTRRRAEQVLRHTES
jgi:tetratricopeptide (TPR) repeat protein